MSVVRMVARVRCRDLRGKKAKQGKRFFVMSIGTRKERFADNKYAPEYMKRGAYCAAFSDEPQIIEATTEDEARQEMKKNGWGDKHFECLGDYATAAEAELCHDDHWPPNPDEEE